MQIVTTGVGPDGRSCVVDRRDLDPLTAAGDLAGPGLRSTSIWGAGEWPPAVAPLGTESADPVPIDARDVRVGEGQAAWRYVHYDPHARADAHRSDTVDFDTVLAGTVDLELEDGTVALAAGDLVVMNGVVHAWQAGPEGCTLAALMFGMAPR